MPLLLWPFISFGLLLMIFYYLFLLFLIFYVFSFLLLLIFLFFYLQDIISFLPIIIDYSFLRLSLKLNICESSAFTNILTDFSFMSFLSFCTIFTILICHPLPLFCPVRVRQLDTMKVDVHYTCQQLKMYRLYLCLLLSTLRTRWLICLSFFLRACLFWSSFVILTTCLFPRSFLPYLRF